MKMQEFESYVSDHYEALVQTAQNVTRCQDAVDMLHALIESICEKRHALPPGKVADLTPGWFGNALKGDLLNQHQAHSRASRKHERFAASLNTLGPEDTYLDTKAMNKAKLARTAKIKRRAGTAAVLQMERDAAELLEPGHLFYGPLHGNVRWRYQQLRDGRLFDERAVRSLADSMHRASQRQLHFQQHGLSHLDWGTESMRTSRPDDGAVGRQILRERSKA